jgi:hypothetical protein
MTIMPKAGLILALAMLLLSSDYDFGIGQRRTGQPPIPAQTPDTFALIFAIPSPFAAFPSGTSTSTIAELPLCAYKAERLSQG